MNDFLEAMDGSEEEEEEETDAPPRKRAPGRTERTFRSMVLELAADGRMLEVETLTVIESPFPAHPCCRFQERTAAQAGVCLRLEARGG